MESGGRLAALLGGHTLPTMNFLQGILIEDDLVQLQQLLLILLCYYFHLWALDVIVHHFEYPFAQASKPREFCLKYTRTLSALVKFEDALGRDLVGKFAQDQRVPFEQCFQHCPHNRVESIFY